MVSYQDHIASVLGGNKQAFSQLVALFNDMAHSIARGRLDDPALAEDAVQEAFLAAYIKLSQLQDHAAFPGWFRTILIRQCGAFRRQQDQAMPPGKADPSDIACDEDNSPYNIYTRQLDQDMVRRVLNDLPGTAREACLLRFVHGLRYEEIAKLLEVPEGTIKRRIHDARNKIVSDFECQRSKTLRVGYLPISDHLLAMVAHSRHDHSDFEVHLSRFLSWGSLVKALSGGHIDAAFIMAPLAMSLRNKGMPLIYVLDGHHDGSAITVRKDISDKDLFKSRMGLPHVASTQRMYLQGMLGFGPDSEAGASSARYISPSYLDRHFTEGRIDGFFCAEPWHTKSEVEGRGRVLARSCDFAPGHVCCGLAVREGFSADNGQLLHEYVNSLLAAAEFATSHPDACARIQSRYTGILRDIALHILERGYITFRDLVPDKSRMEQSMRMAVRSTILDNPCDLDGFMRLEYS